MDTPFVGTLLVLADRSGQRLRNGHVAAKITRVGFYILRETPKP